MAKRSRKTKEQPPHTLRNVTVGFDLRTDRGEALTIADAVLSGDGRRVMPTENMSTPHGRALSHVCELLKRWGRGALNDNGDKVRAYLAEHRNESFNRLVVRIADGLRRMARTWQGDRHPVKSWGELADVLEQWHRTDGQRSGKVKVAQEWPDLKSLALFRAYRHEAGDVSADITNANCEQVASVGGFTTKSSGKELLAHFRRYAWGRPNDKRIERTKEGKRRGDVLKRLNTVIEKLEGYPNARVMAEGERNEVRTRSNRYED